MSNNLPKRKKGAQPGNNNAHKHGFYSIKPEVLQRFNADMIGEGADEIQMLSSVVDITLATFNQTERPTLEQCQTTLRAVSQAADSIRGLYLMKKVLYANFSTMEQIMDELGKLPPEED
jgi:hypothetical protein